MTVLRHALVYFVLSFISCVSSLFCSDLSLLIEEDESEHLVAMTGKLQLMRFHSDSEDAESALVDCWILKLDSESFDRACRTPVRASFQTPVSIRSSRNGDEMELTGGYDIEWLHEKKRQTVTVRGYLWHAHTGHHHTLVMLDAEPWDRSR